jgi:predicted permease
MNIPFRRGADFTDRDDEAGRPVVIINETMARQYWPNENPMGAQLLLGMDGFVPREVVGVVGDVRSAGLSRAPVPETYVPHPQAAIFSMSIAVRTDVDAAAILPVVRQRMAAIDPALPIIKPQMMTTAVEASAGAMRLSSTLTVLFALLAALLATVGIYSLIAYSVAQRTREIGIRMALGATAGAVLSLILKRGAILILIGTAAGLAGAIALTRLIKTLLFGVSATEPAVFAVAAVLLILTALLAAYIPGRRATKVDPLVALRHE